MLFSPVVLAAFFATTMAAPASGTTPARVAMDKMEEAADYCKAATEDYDDANRTLKFTCGSTAVSVNLNEYIANQDSNLAAASAKGQGRFGETCLRCRFEETDSSLICVGCAYRVEFSKYSIIAINPLFGWIDESQSLIFKNDGSVVNP